MELLRAADRLTAPWKNGGGETREVTLFPAGGGWTDFHWRISIATVETSGRFSLFPGIDRTLAVLDGRLRLTVDAVAQPVQQPLSPPVRFDGGAQTLGEVIEGPVTDLNLMVRRGTCQGSLTPLAEAIDRPIRDRRVVIATMPIDLGHIRLASLDALMLVPGEPLPLFPRGARGWIVTVTHC